ncbi:MULTISPECIES: hypothetical protein [unclassified Coleofasciculus]|uniref:hypothetical protein n=1 Tax=unclassified Coleofasciculus TaxID=2692782 RepID=UPI00187F2A0D|nr:MULTISPECIES: hypothetical protein [unclassified Coleofasciculus]MBE9128756.1 hypothetical protein [Coleofasciculus sp. LEGE 07081]MBE9150858.1 hypothetical protein [Coleofasciculus sp. LEGE 07092]
MNIDQQQLLARIEALRIPLDDPISPMDWKDWYHFILIDPQSGLRVLVNITLIGRPEQGQIQVSLIVNLPSEWIAQALRPDTPLATFGTTFCREWQTDTVRQSPLLVKAPGIHLEVNGRTSVLEVQDERSQLLIRFQGEAEAIPLLVTEDAPFGSGFIGWGLVPGVNVLGELSVCGQSFSIHQNWFCYHDRNFGRFRWGEDIGWEWFVVCATTDDGRSIICVLDRRTNKNHSISGMPYIFIYLGRELRKVFLGSSLQIHWDWSPSPTLPLRLPGTMASLFADRTLKLPHSLQVEGADEQDRLSLKLQFEAEAELIVPDNQERQYSFIEEVTGNAEVNLSLQGEIFRATGFVYGEYVH